MAIFNCQHWVPSMNPTKLPPNFGLNSDIGFHQTPTLFPYLVYSTICILFPSNSIPVFLHYVTHCLFHSLCIPITPDSWLHVLTLFMYELPILTVNLKADS